MAVLGVGVANRGI